MKAAAGLTRRIRYEGGLFLDTETGITGSMG